MRTPSPTDVSGNVLAMYEGATAAHAPPEVFRWRTAQSQELLHAKDKRRQCDRSPAFRRPNMTANVGTQASQTATANAPSQHMKSPTASFMDALGNNRKRTKLHSFPMQSAVPK